MTKRFQFSLATLFLAVTLAAGVSAAGAYFYHEVVLARAAAVRASNTIKLKQVVTHLHLYNEEQQRLPPSIRFDKTGRPTISWRFNLLPYFEQQDLDDPPHYDQAWDSPGNAHVRASYPNIPVYCFNTQAGHSAKASHTNVFAITGPGTPFDPQLNIQGSFARLVTDPATKDTILLVEVRNSKTHWMQPGDFDIRTMPHTINDPAGEGISGTCPGCFCVGFADGEAWMLRNDTPFDKLALFFTIDSARKHDREVELGQYRVK